MKMHLNLTTRDLSASVAFYRTLFAVEPAKNYDDYALFLVDDPGLELALDPAENTQAAHGVHYGVVAEHPEDVERAIGRLQNAGYPIRVETGETCCYAVQNKVWATDPDGRHWETYFVLSESEQRDDADTTCCSDDAPKASACC